MTNRAPRPVDLAAAAAAAAMPGHSVSKLHLLAMIMQLFTFMMVHVVGNDMWYAAADFWQTSACYDQLGGEQGMCKSPDESFEQYKFRFVHTLLASDCPKRVFLACARVDAAPDFNNGITESMLSSPRYAADVIARLNASEASCQVLAVVSRLHPKYIFDDNVEVLFAEAGWRTTRSKNCQLKIPFLSNAAFHAASALPPLRYFPTELATTSVVLFVTLIFVLPPRLYSNPQDAPASEAAAKLRQENLRNLLRCGLVLFPLVVCMGAFAVAIAPNPMSRIVLGAALLITAIMRFVKDFVLIPFE